MSLSQIEYFVAVAEEGHVGRAARRLRISQPPLSRQIGSLEQELGAPLFQRTARGMVLLPGGERFLEHARRILDEVAQAKTALSSASLASAAPASHSDHRRTPARSSRKA